MVQFRHIDKAKSAGERGREKHGAASAVAAYDPTRAYVAPRLQIHEFNWIKNYLYRNTGITLGLNKHALVMGRLEKRLRQLGCLSYTEYFRLLEKPGNRQEVVIAIDLLTTNETYFFREPPHFDFLKQLLQTCDPYRPFRIWSAASSSGEEAYSAAMLAASHARTPHWEVVGSDICSTVLERARSGLYPLKAAGSIPQSLLKHHCLRGSGEYEDYFLIGSDIRKRVKFLSVNLVKPLPDLGRFDVIFLRNAMIYFDVPTKTELVNRIWRVLPPGGHFLVGHAESLTGINHNFVQKAPAVYIKQ